MKKTILALFILMILVLAACSLGPKVRIESGTYTTIHQTSDAAKVIQGMRVDREAQIVTLIMFDGQEIEVPYTARDQSEWPSGCPTNIYSTRMEVFDLDITELAIGSLLISNPILVRNCPEDPYKIILREDGEIGGAGTGCLIYEECIFFEIK